MASLERQLRFNYLLLESRGEKLWGFKYKEEVNLNFYKVDGAQVRSNPDEDTEFIGGGHHLVYNWIPDNEAWLEDTFSKEELSFFSMHEIFEYLLMKYERKSYDRAHDIANHYEGLLRHNPKDYEDIIKSYVEDDFTDKEDLEKVLFDFWLSMR